MSSSRFIAQERRTASERLVESVILVAVLRNVILQLARNRMRKERNRGCARGAGKVVRASCVCDEKQRRSFRVHFTVVRTEKDADLPPLGVELRMTVIK